MMRPLELMLALALLAAAGCASGESYVQPGYDFGGIKRVAIADVSGWVGGEGARNQISDFFAFELLKHGYEPVERQQVRALLSEQEFQQADFTSREGAARLGRIANVEAVILVNVSRFDDEGISMTAKMIDVEDGSILWVATGSARTGRSALTVLGAGIGAAIGWMAGGDKDTKQAGAVGGAVIGGVGGYSLSPQKEKQTRKAIRDMFKSFPSRR